MRRLRFLDIAKALCIIAVVLGHFNPSSTTEAWDRVTYFLNSFHMPLFMFASGMLFSYGRKNVSYLTFLRGKLKRIAVPYLITSVAIILIKLSAQTFVSVDHSVEPFSLVRMFWYPSAAYHLWFLWVLMTIFLIVPLFKSKKSVYALTGLALILHFLPVEFPSIFCLFMFKEMFIFFMLGVLFNMEGGLKLFEETRFSKRGLLMTLPLLAVAEWYFLFVKWNILEYFVTCILGIAAVLFVSRLISTMKTPCLDIVAECSFFIYLTHSIFTEMAKAGMSLVGVDMQAYFVPACIVTTLAGVLIPIVIKKAANRLFAA